jgi:hypothetical protein
MRRYPLQFACDATNQTIPRSSTFLEEFSSDVSRVRYLPGRVYHWRLHRDTGARGTRAGTR